MLLGPTVSPRGRRECRSRRCCGRPLFSGYVGKFLWEIYEIHHCSIELGNDTCYCLCKINFLRPAGFIACSAYFNVIISAIQLSCEC